MNTLTITKIDEQDEMVGYEGDRGNLILIHPDPDINNGNIDLLRTYVAATVTTTLK